MHGNVSEWCRDWFWGYAESTTEKGTGLRTSEKKEDKVPKKVLRGGDFRSRIAYSRTATRRQAPVSHSSMNIGLRPARALQGDWILPKK